MVVFSSIWTKKLLYLISDLFTFSLRLSHLEVLLLCGFRLKPRIQSCFISVWEREFWGGMLCSRKMFDFLLRKDVRKILKRKDSDAGEKGTCPYSCFCKWYYKFFSFIFLKLFSMDLPSIFGHSRIWVFHLQAQFCNVI